MAKRYNKMRYIFIVIVILMTAYTLLNLYFEYRLDKRIKKYEETKKAFEDKE